MTWDWLRTPLQTLAQVCVQQPLSQPVAADDEIFKVRKGTFRLAFRAARRALLLRTSGQMATLRTRLDHSFRRVLWIHEGMPQIGDALMDLAPRSLLVEQGFEVDLFSSPHIAAMFEHDTWFTRSLCKLEDLHIDAYDAAIVLSHDRKALGAKRTRLAGLPWVSLHGFYGGPDFHRSYFATQRLADLLNLTLDAQEFARHSAQKLPISAQAIAKAQQLCPDTDTDGVALALGGVWPDRTYSRWPQLIKLLNARGVQRFILIGGENGRKMADCVVAESPPDVQILDFVGRTHLLEAHALFARCAAIVCADGGLMHLALTTDVPVVALFNSTIDPLWRLPTRFNGVCLSSCNEQVNDLSEDSVADAVMKALHPTEAEPNPAHILHTTTRAQPFINTTSVRHNNAPPIGTPAE